MKNTLSVLLLSFAACLFADIPLPEHPRPDWERAQWLNLNGTWKFAFDKIDAGEKDKWFSASDEKFDKSIVVPFPWGSKLSEVGDEADIGWYRREFELPERPAKGDSCELCFDGVDDEAWVWLNGTYIGQHDEGIPGCGKPFRFDVTKELKWGAKNVIVVRINDMGNAGGIDKGIRVEVLQCR